MNTTKRLFATAGVAILAVAAGADAAGQTMRTITATGGRPLWHALDALEVEVGGTVNYEDVPYENAADCRDVSTPQWRATAPPGYQLLVPRLGTVTADIPVPANGAVTQNELIYEVNLLLTSYRQNHLPGDFQVQEANGMLYVTATKVLGANGAVHAVTSPMLAAITVPTADRSVGGTVQAIFDAVGIATGLRFGLDRLPFWPSQRVTFGAAGEVARDALARLFAQLSSRPLSYRLIFAPKCDRMRTTDYIVDVAPSGYVAPMALPGYGPINKSAGSAPPVPASAHPPGAPRPNQGPAKP